MFIKDRHEINSSRTYTDEGFLIVSANIARTGIQEYMASELGLTDREPTDVISIYRPPEEVFAKASMDSFANKPITNNHPPVLVTSENAKQFSVGHSGPEVTKDGVFMAAVLYVTDAESIKDIEEGKIELSNGYTSDLEWEAGISPDGRKFDAIQKNIKGNHIALVDRGRCGVSCRVSDNEPKFNEEPVMAKITIDGVDFEVTDQAAQAVGKLQTQLKDAEEETKKKEDEAEEAKEEKEKVAKDHKATLDAKQALFDDSQSKIPGPDMLDTLVANRMSTRDAALKINPEYKFEGKDCETIRKEIVSDAVEGIKIDDMSVDYIRARFDALTTGGTPQNTLDTALQLQLVKDKSVKDKSTVVSVADARQAMVERSRNQWKKAGGAS